MGAVMMRGGKLIVLSILVLAAIAVVIRLAIPRGLDQSRFDALYETPQAVAPGPQRVFHLGHSLVGRDMPAMLAQLTGQSHRYESQLGWGTPLKAHWDPDTPINGFAEENDHPRYRDAKEALASAEYDALILTEMVEIKDAIKHFDSPAYLSKWADAGWAAKPELRVYLYETWHPLDDPDGWLARIDADLARHWEGQILRPALADREPIRPIYVIPAGQVMAQFVRAVEDQGGVDGITNRQDLFSDEIHLSDLGAYLVALTHYAVLYQSSPIGLPHQLVRADGTMADAPTEEAARLMQATVWDVVRNYPRAGLPDNS
ncbi:hypothetical protein [Yoonia sp. SS1-5]|uniref:Uncharacterized protein n=1 Tax=Yoonia rhodophyticola TaxID=3137370 RepID=A0AAN0NKF9_9RHOB